jgi:hypothetical protein
MLPVSRNCRDIGSPVRARPDTVRTPPPSLSSASPEPQQITAPRLAPAQPGGFPANPPSPHFTKFRHLYPASSGAETVSCEHPGSFTTQQNRNRRGGLPAYPPSMEGGGFGPAGALHDGGGSLPTSPPGWEGGSGRPGKKLWGGWPGTPPPCPATPGGFPAGFPASGIGTICWFHPNDPKPGFLQFF